MSEPLIRLKGIERRYQSGEHEVTVLHPLDLAIDAGEMVAIVGASGSGKSTLMNLLGCLDRPSGGQYLFRGQDTASRLQRHAEHFYLTEQVAGEANAFTTVELIENRGAHSLYRLHPTTGKKHQLRVHMMGLGMPLLNDGLYPVALPMDVVDYEKPLKLLARSIRFVDPIMQQERRFESQLQL